MGARARGAPKRKSLAKLRAAAIRATRREVLSPLASPVVPGASNWVQLGPTAIPAGQTYGGARVLVSGRITDILVSPDDPQVLYAAAARGGVWKSMDEGVSWAPKSDNEASLAIGALALAPSAPTHSTPARARATSTTTGSPIPRARSTSPTRAAGS